MGYITSARRHHLCEKIQIDDDENREDGTNNFHANDLETTFLPITCIGPLTQKLLNGSSAVSHLESAEQKKYGGETIVMKYKEWMLYDEYFINLKIACYIIIKHANFYA